MTRTKLLNLGLILASFIVYLEWGADKEMFLIEVEAELFSKLFKDPLSIIHPLTLIPLVGQGLLIFTLFQKRPSKRLTYFGLGGMGVLVLLIFFIGIISKNFKILLSTIPFLVIGILVIRNYIKSKQSER